MIWGGPFFGLMMRRGHTIKYRDRLDEPTPVGIGWLGLSYFSGSIYLEIPYLEKCHRWNVAVLFLTWDTSSSVYHLPLTL